MDAFFGTHPAVLDPRLAFGLGAATKAAIVLLVAAMVVGLLRRSSASARHAAWTAGLAAALAVPVLGAMLPVWNLPVWSRPTVERSSIPAAPPAPDRVEDSFTLRIASPERPSISPAPSLPSSNTGFPTSEVAKTQSPAIDWMALIFGAWAAGVVVVLGPMITGRLQLGRLRRRSERLADGPDAALAQRLAAWVCPNRRVTFLLGDDEASPMTWGVIRPIVFLPASSARWPEERLQAVLLHELAHVRRRDCLTQVVARLACALYWFNPLAWWAASRLRAERERACDDLVLEAGQRPSSYATHLLAVARLLGRAPATALPMARRSTLEPRLRAILDATRDRRVVGPRALVLMLASVAAVALPLAVARPVSRPDAPIAAPTEAAMTVTGRVLDPDGRPLAGAKVAIVGRRKLPLLNARAGDQHEVMGSVEADAEGRFRMNVRRTSSVSHYEAHAVAAHPGFGLGWTELNRDAHAPSADVRLLVEQVVEGRLVDLQGLPATGVEARPGTIGIRRPKIGGYDGVHIGRDLKSSNDLAGICPTPAATDADGRFRIHGVGRGVSLNLQVDDPRYARQTLRVQTDDEAGPKQVTLPLEPAMTVAGRVICADTGEPLRDTLVQVGSGDDQFSSGGSDYRTDADGRYRANPAPGKFVKVTVYPSVGSPYLIFEKNFESGDQAKREVDLAVPRGVLITGQVVERGTGRPVGGSAVLYGVNEGNVVDGEGTIPGWMAAVPSDAEGRYSIAVAPGKGHLLFYGPTADFVHQVKGDRELASGNPGGQRQRAHAFIPYEVKVDQEPLQVDPELTPGVTLTGQVVGPDGRTVDAAEIITTLSISPFHTFWRGDFTIPVRDGRFELHGLSPDQPVRCMFLDARNGLGTTVELTGAMAADGPLTVTLQPSGQATVRLVDEEGKAAEGRGVSLGILGTDGPPAVFDADLGEEEKAMLRADESFYVNVDRINYWPDRGPRSGADGRVTLPALIPGATYRIYEYVRKDGEDSSRWRDFTVEPGQTLDLGDVRVKSSDR